MFRWGKFELGRNLVSMHTYGRPKSSYVFFGVGNLYIAGSLYGFRRSVLWSGIVENTPPKTILKSSLAVKVPRKITEKYFLEVLVKIGLSQSQYEIALMFSLNINSVCVVDFRASKLIGFFFKSFVCSHISNPRLHKGEGTSGTRGIQESTGDRQNFR